MPPPSCSDRGPPEARPFAMLRVTATATVILSEAKNLTKAKNPSER